MSKYSASCVLDGAMAYGFIYMNNLRGDQYITKLNGIIYILTFSIPPIFIVKKGKAVPVQPWTGPEGSRRLRLPDFKTIVT